MANATKQFNDQTTSNRNWLTGTFKDRESAESAYNSLASRGYTKDDVNLLMSDDTRSRHFADDDSALGSKAMEGAGTGGGGVRVWWCGWGDGGLTYPLKYSYAVGATHSRSHTAKRWQLCAR